MQTPELAFDSEEEPRPPDIEKGSLSTDAGSEKKAVVELKSESGEERGKKQTL